MEPNETQQNYYNTSTTTATAAVTTAPSPTNGLLQGGDGTHMLYPHAMASAVTSPLEPARRKRGRPRKYGTPEQALAAKKTASSSSSRERREHQQQQAMGGSLSGSSKKSQLSALGNPGQGFTPHVINVAGGEDVAQKIMLFLQQSRREICILSASGSISNASLRQPATSGGNVTYEGRFEIVSLSGSYVRTEIGGRTGGLSVCLSSTDGQIIGGGVGGPLKAAGPVQVIVGTFVVDAKKDAGPAVPKVDTSSSRLPTSMGGPSIPGLNFRSPFDSSGRNPVGASDDHHTIGGHFMLQPQGIHMTSSRPTEWRSGPDGSNPAAGYEMTGGRHHSPENGDYE